MHATSDETRTTPPRLICLCACASKVVSKDFIPIEKNFILLMEKNSHITKENLFLLCLDGQSASVFNGLGVSCARVTGLTGHKMVYKMRVKVLNCIVRIVFNYNSPKYL